VGLAGHAAPLAFALGGVVALLTGLSYSSLGLHFRSDGGSFTYLEHAFAHPNVAGLGGWVLLAGYIGTMALYAFTFGVYGNAILGGTGHDLAMKHLLQSGVLLTFLGVNLYGVKSAGHTEDVIVLVKVLILSLFAVVGLVYMKKDHVLPFFNRGGAGLLMGAALIFVAYEGFELIPNAVKEMRQAQRDLPRSITMSIVVTTLIYILVSMVAIGNLSPAAIDKYKEYALAEAARPFLGHAGFLLIGLGALLSTASAINATLFGTARLGKVMAEENELPRAFSLHERTREIPWFSLCLITALTLVLVNLGGLTMISAFASATFLLVFASINLAALRLRNTIGISPAAPFIGLVLTLTSWGVLAVYLWEHQRSSLVWIAVAYTGIAVAELCFSERRVLFRRQ